MITMDRIYSPGIPISFTISLPIVMPALAVIENDPVAVVECNIAKAELQRLEFKSGQN